MLLSPVGMSRMVALGASVVVQVEPDWVAVLVAKHDCSFHIGSHYKECFSCEKPYTKISSGDFLRLKIAKIYSPSLCKI